MLNKLDELVKKQEEYALRLSREIFVFDTIIHDMEEKYKQPASIFLQDVGETLSRCKMWEFQEPPEVSSELEEKLCAISKNYLILHEHVQVFRETFPEEAAVKWVKITFDPDTAHPKLQVYADQKILREATSSKESYPQRFTAATCVLGCEGFTSGRHYWEVKVREEAHWAVGVARESVDRKEKLELNPKEGIWVIKNEYKELRADSCYLYSSIPKRVGVFLDYRLRRVLFFDADDGRALYTFHSVSLQDEKIRPFFWLQKPWDCKAEACYIELCA
ncbi:tripartite motif-containing protein 15-like [Eublepharis macularius]|uniref:Tripartite motif-containing protein 15-like n=1 Tax=Eublepharis macularius TaxID=481883 RepID=A0AA97J5D1_EUBMA|nr:tripartite motif-containing protein 15-like [Eublepharis macularius]